VKNVVNPLLDFLMEYTSMVVVVNVANGTKSAQHRVHLTCATSRVTAIIRGIKVLLGKYALTAAHAGNASRWADIPPGKVI